MEIKIGCDVGNYDTKTQLTNTSSSYLMTETEPLITDELLYFEDRFYAPTLDRNHQEKDKTANDYCIIMTLFGIAKEILAQCTSTAMTAEAIQKQVSEVSNIRLGVGLPAGYFSSLAKPTLEYYKNRFKNGVSFAYKGPKTKKTKIYFNIKFSNIGIYPQDVLAALKNPNLSIPKVHEDFNIIGFGGGTIDVCPVRNGQPQVQDVVTIEMGTTYLYAEIAKGLQLNGFQARDYIVIEKVLTGKPTVLKPEEEDFIRNYVKKYGDKVIKMLLHEKVDLSGYASIFVGGGGLLFKDFFESSKAFAKVEFISSVNINAEYYAKAV